MSEERRRKGRARVEADAAFRTPGYRYTTAQITDLSPTGCSLEHVWVARGDSLGWLRLPGLDGVQCRVAWSQGSRVGLEFDQPLHGAVADLLLKRWTAGAAPKD